MELVVFFLICAVAYFLYKKYSIEKEKRIIAETLKFCSDMGVPDEYVLGRDHEFNKRVDIFIEKIKSKGINSEKSKIMASAIYRSFIADVCADLISYSLECNALICTEIDEFFDRVMWRNLKSKNSVLNLIDSVDIHELLNVFNVTQIDLTRLFKDKKISIDKLPPSINHLPNLEIIMASDGEFYDYDTYGIELSTLDMDYLSKCKKLEAIYLNVCGIENIKFNEKPSSKSLKVICIESNLITEIPRNIFSLTNLHTLRLSDNNISEIPIEIGNLKHLSYISVSFNEKIKISERITTIPNLSFDSGISESILNNQTTKVRDWINSR